MVDKVETPSPQTVVFRLKEPYASFLVNLIPNAAGIVPANAPADFARHLIGTGPFKFASQSQDEDVQLVRNENYFNGAPTIEFLHFRIVPDAVVRALELRKGSADLEMSSLSPDLIPALVNACAYQAPRHQLRLPRHQLRGSSVGSKEVRQALAFATDRAALIRYLLHGQAQAASGILPPNHWTYEPNVAQYSLETMRAEQLLDSAGFPRGANGIRFRFTLKTSTEERARVVGAALHEQWQKVGIDLELRPLEPATLHSDASRGSFQLTYAGWVGANNEPDFFEFAFSSKRFPPDGANSGLYRNPRIDALTEQIHVESNQEKRKAVSSEVQKILADDLPYIFLWFTDVVSVHRRELGDLRVSPTGDYDFLTTLRPATQQQAQN